MQILLACAKIMTGTAPEKLPVATEPTFLTQANANVRQLLQYSVEELQDMLGCNHDIAAENHKRFQQFFDTESLVPAVFAYDGMVFQKLAPETFSDSELRYANEHLLIGSFIYGLLRPLDMVHRYRMEGNVVLPENGVSMFDYWKPVLTDWFISKIKSDDGILVNLASNEFKDLFDWKRVKKEVKVITPQFKVDKGGKLSNIVIYTKMCRGAMTKWILKNRITDINELKLFEFEGYVLNENAGEWMFVNGA
ncbi:MAG: YaaA family protein [Bacteroidales bacterium]|nr:YaaA family protein [Bacteroidales bacterium]